MSLARAAWLTTVFAFCLTSVLLFATGYVGYGFVFLAVAAAAAVNLF